MSEQITIVEEWCGWAHDESINEDKMWAAAYSAEGYFISVWGARDTRYNPTVKKFASEYEARAWYSKKVQEKIRKRYMPVPFSQDDRTRYVQIADGRYTLHGAIPSFHIVNNPWLKAITESSGRDSEITFDSLLLDMRKLLSALNSKHRGDVTPILASYQTISVQVSVWAELHTGAAARDIKDYFNQLEDEMERTLLAI